MQQGLKVLSIGSDRKILEDGSAVWGRIRDYANLVGELHIVLMSDKTHGLHKRHLFDNVWVYPTNSLSKYLRPIDASKLGKKIVLERKFVRGEALVTTQDPFECGLAGLKVKKKWRLPMEVQLHTDPFSPYFKGSLNILRKAIARKVLRNADSVRVVSEGLKERVSKYTDASVCVLPIYVDKPKIESAKVSFDLRARYSWKFIILAVSRLSPEKNLGLAIRVLSLAIKRFPDMGLIVVGSGPEEAKLKKLVKKLKLEDSVAFVGWQEDLASYYKTASVFIQTSLFEGYGLSLVEAGLYGLPIVTTSVGIAKDLQHGHDAYIYSEHKPELFVEGIMELLESNEKRENLRINMRRTLESKLLSKDDYLNKMKEIWEKTANNVEA